MMEYFDAFGIVWKDRSNNKMADLLANIVVQPDDITLLVYLRLKLKIGLLFLIMSRIGKYLKMTRTF